ncbi:MAG TPA: MarP family serine protease [Candidatus Limnocylindrales bacterium]|nr:MarP family serine protease [Candidatus Limnocylindrales bacterium]
MNPLDAGAIALLILAVLLGWRSGALPQVAGLGGAVLGAVAGLAAVPWLLPALADVPVPVRAGAVLLVLLGCVGIGEALGARLGRSASSLLGTGLLGAFDRVGGAIVGAGQAVLIIWLAGGILASGAIPQLGQIAQGSRAVRAITAVLPPPTEVVIELGRALEEAGLPDVFLGLERLPAAPVELPDDPLARRIAGAAAGSVLRVQADACRYRSTGTGFAIASGYVVTNAHVVAGAGAITVDGPAGRWSAEVVFFDPDLDVALLHVRGLVAPSLIFATSTPGRGALGATIGYPGGGDAVVEPAAVTDTYSAEGRDITGTERVTRRIVELRARVEPGDSGGPLLLVDGTVGGVVFAESRTDDTVGYALAPTDVAIAVGPSVGRTVAVNPGPCIR